MRADNHPLKTILIKIGQPILYILLGLIYFTFLALNLIFNTLIKPISSYFKKTLKHSSPSSSYFSSNAQIFAELFSFFILSSTVAIFATIILFFYQYIFTTLPDYRLLTSDTSSTSDKGTYQIPLTTRIYDRHHQLLYQIYKDQNRFLVQLHNLPTYLIQAHIAIEDRHFYQHPGINPLDIARAGLHNLQEYYHCYQQHPISTYIKWENKLPQILKPSQINCKIYIQGGSTITQQLVKNTLLTRERTLQRKLQEAILAIQIETKLSKSQIIEKYLNQVSYGGTAYGIEAAARTYFNKPASQLNLAESALLAGLPAAPSNYSPFGSQPDLAKQRQEQVLQRMQVEGYITEDQKLTAIGYQLIFTTPDTSIKAPHFVMYTRSLLEDQFGPEQISQGGLEVTTTLDLQLQEFTQQILKSEILNLKPLNVTNGAVLVTKPSTGEILAMVGSIDYFDISNQGNVNATTAIRQPGSAIKPVNYAVALSLPLTEGRGGVTPPLHHGNQLTVYTPSTLLSDTPVRYEIPGQPPYSPSNYDNRFHGNVSIRTALASSYNIPAVKLLNSYGIEKMITTGKAMGISTWENPNKYGLSLTLGGGEVKMTDMAVVYGTLANLGYRVNLNPIIKVNGSSENNLLDPDLYLLPPILDPRVAFIINHILSDSTARAPAFGNYSKLNIVNHTVAVKTGTSNNLRDNWTIGYTPDYLVAVWVGNFDNSPMSRIASGITGATPIWNQIMTYLLNDYSSNTANSLQLTTNSKQLKTKNLKLETDFPWHIPIGLIEVSICPYTATLPCAGCPTQKEWFIEGTQPARHCSPSQFISPTPSPIP